MRTRDVWIEATALTLLAAFLYQSAIGLFVFLVPLEVLRRRRGADWMGLACVATGGVILVSRITSLMRLDVEWDAAVLLMEMLPPVVFLAGLYLLDTRLITGVRRVYRLLQATLIAGAASVPVIMLVSSSSVAMEAFRSQFELLHGMLTAGSEQAAGAGRYPTVDALMRSVLDLLLSTFLFAYATVLGGNWFVGQLIGARTRGERAFRLREFRLPEVFVWMLTAAAAAALLSLLGDLGVFEHLAWNGLFVALLLYGGQGLGILWALLDRWEVARGIRIGLGVALAVLLLVPGANLLVILGLPGLGVAETWIQFRPGERSF
jgi:hypothetical protein